MGNSVVDVKAYNSNNITKRDKFQYNLWEN